MINSNHYYCDLQGFVFGATPEAQLAEKRHFTDCFTKAKDFLRGRCAEDLVAIWMNSGAMLVYGWVDVFNQERIIFRSNHPRSSLSPYVMRTCEHSVGFTSELKEIRVEHGSVSNI